RYRERSSKLSPRRRTHPLAWNSPTRLIQPRNWRTRRRHPARSSPGGSPDAKGSHGDPVRRETSGRHDRTGIRRHHLFWNSFATGNVAASNTSVTTGFEDVTHLRVPGHEELHYFDTITPSSTTVELPFDTIHIRTASCTTPFIPGEPGLPRRG